jgi:hypothetical protein
MKQALLVLVFPCVWKRRTACVVFYIYFSCFLQFFRVCWGAEVLTRGFFIAERRK